MPFLVRNGFLRQNRVLSTIANLFSARRFEGWNLRKKWLGKQHKKATLNTEDTEDAEERQKRGKAI
jgi:hypothetical protein